MRSIACCLVTITLAVAVPSACALDVTGTVNDALGNPVPELKVRVFRVNTWGADVEYPPVYTIQDGTYWKSINQDGLPASFNVYVKVNWHLRLGPNYGDKHIIIERRGGHDGAGDWHVTGTFTEATSGTAAATPSGIVTMPTVAMGQRQPSPAPAGAANAGTTNIRRDIMRTLDYVRTNKRQDTNWTFAHDIPVEISESDPPHQGSHQSQGTLRLHVRTHDNGSFNGQHFPHLHAHYGILVLFHEMAHAIHYRIGMPAGGCGGSHTYNSENNPTCALVEGWASYLAVLVADANALGDAFHWYRDVHRTNWRGGGNITPPGGVAAATDGPFNPTGRDPSSLGYGAGPWESGEPVEGALSGFWFSLQGLYSFGDQFHVMVNAQPANVAEFCQGWIAEHAALPARIVNMHKMLQQHGIVYSRALFANAPFDVTGPPNQAPAQAGNRVIVDGFEILRGTVPTKFEAASAGRLGVGSTYGISMVRMHWKPAQPAGMVTLDQSFSDFPGNTHTVWASLADNAVQFVTNGLPDGDYDLLMQGRNEHGFDDNFNPDWMGDDNPEVATNEKYLKTVGAWYDRDQDHTTPAGTSWTEGRVILDNTPPKLVPGSAFPPPGP